MFGLLWGLLAAAGATGGNDAISLAPKLKPADGKDLQQQDGEDEGGARPDKDFDFAAYVNDFNLQEEASIPEDIFDQHDGDIEDEDAGVSPQLQYPAAPLGPLQSQNQNQDEDQDPDEKEIPAEEDQEQDESEDDASEAADIILESQRPTARNLSAYLDAKKHPNNNGSKRSKDKDWARDKDKGKDKGRKNNLSHYNYKLKNNKERVANEEAPPPAPAAGQPRKANGGDGGADFPTKLASASLEDQEDSANFGRQSFSYKKLKNMHEQQNQQKEHPKDGQESREQDPSSPQLFDSIEILNERKFNKPIEAEQVKTGETAIGDIEDNLDNDEESDQHPEQQEQEEEQEQEDDEEEEEEDIKSSIDNDELAKRYYPPTTTTEPTTLPTTTSTSSTTTARTSTTSSTTAPRTTTTFRTSRTPQQQPTIGRKLKRHGNAFGPKKPQSPENRYYEMARIKEQQQQEQEDSANVGELHYYDTGSHYNQKLATYDPEKSEENYLSGQQPRRNATDWSSSSSSRFLDDEYSEPQPPPEERRQWQIPAEKPVERDGNSEGFGAGKLESDLDSGPQPYHSGSLTAATPTPASAFERFKALRRSRQRTGHKSHKKRYKDYLKWQVASTPGTLSSRHLQKLEKEKALERERERERQQEKDKEEQRPLGHSAPIFALGLRPAKPFYEGQVSYYDKQEPVQDLELDQPDLEHRTEMERLIAHDNGNWYRRISPVLRNGVKSGVELKHHHHRGHHSGHHQGHHLSHHHLQNHHHHHHHHQGNHKTNHLRSRPSSPYQRKPPAQNSMGVALSAPLPGAPSGSVPGPQPTPTPPLPPPKQELGHQITELEHLERYYAKWPHLARVQFQVYDEHYREAHPELYEDYEDADYESAAELEEAQQERGEEANLPPYIKKYNRRNKQLLNLLEGTLPTPTAFPPAGLAGSPPPPHLDDEYLQEKRRRYHQHHFEDLFAQQKSAAEHKGSKDLAEEAGVTTPFSNHLPEDSPEGESPAVQQPKASDFWPGKVQVVVAPTSTPKPALFKLPSYPAIAGSFLGTPRSRSAQFVANVAGRGQSSWTQNATGSAGAAGAAGGGVGAAVAAGSPPRGAPSPLNSFVYHRVVDSPGNANGVPPVSGLVGSGIGRRQSRLPFVAITDRRMESLTGKRSLAERHKDFQQNHFPMP
ncbi:hypothetical protein KR074_003767 [Drosophila pseudoananassae]|nr:hypothetical protein KR074_003767 [Drosophila pseudoananassae]